MSPFDFAQGDRMGIPFLVKLSKGTECSLSKHLVRFFDTAHQGVLAQNDRKSRMTKLWSDDECSGKNSEILGGFGSKKIF